MTHPHRPCMVSRRISESAINSPSMIECVSISGPQVDPTHRSLHRTGADPVQGSLAGVDGCYGLARLIDKRGRDAKVIDWLDELTAEGPKRQARNMNDPCGAQCPPFAKVLESFSSSAFAQKVGM